MFKVHSSKEYFSITVDNQTCATSWSREQLTNESESPEDLPKNWSEEMDLAPENLCWATSDEPTVRLREKEITFLLLSHYSTIFGCMKNAEDLVSSLMCMTSRVDWW